MDIVILHLEFALDLLWTDIFLNVDAEFLVVIECVIYIAECKTFCFDQLMKNIIFVSS